ncbi:MAG: hypothetical protein H7290_12215 [Flavobacterium sp.]|nr:hypothetical protein [Aeromicrobium sp.]
MQRLGNETTPVDLTVRALGIVTLLEVGAADQLRSSLSFRAPGKVKFRETLTEMMHKLFP